VGDACGQIEIQTSDYDRPWNYGAFSIETGFNAERQFDRAVRTEKINVISLDDDPLLLEIDKIDLIKADVEGLEVKVILGGQETHRTASALFVSGSRRRRGRRPPGRDPVGDQLRRLLVPVAPV
jgi:FkbM family methyltransferase